MHLTYKATLAALLALLLAAGVGLYWTSGSPAPPAREAGVSNGLAPAINRRFLGTALELARTVATPEEQHAAKRALDAADHELDLEYACALQVAALTPVPDTPEIRAIQRRIARISAAVEIRQAEVAQLKAAVARAKGTRREVLSEQLEVSQAELSLYREAVTDARYDLIQADGDPKSRLDGLKAEHAAASTAADRFRFRALPDVSTSGSLLARWSRWREIARRLGRVEQAREEALDAAAGLTRRRDTLEKSITGEKSQREAFKSRELTPAQVAALANSPRRSARPGHNEHKKSAPAPSPTGASAQIPLNPAIALIQHLSADQILARLLDRRAKAMDDLAGAYASWGKIVSSQVRSALHDVLGAVLWVVLIMLFAFVLTRIIERSLARLILEQKQRITLAAILRISVRLTALLVILMMIFGKPAQISTVVGLAGAGLAVALQDFILSFLGWFVLMGRNGIHVGDWVEINSNSFSGVRGEVLEITLLRTVLLETGNWNESGHLTGRQVAFMNMYAVTGYYFNLSTAGQWLWDELQVAIPAGENPYPLMEQIGAIVARETEANAALAENEWQRFSSRYGTRTLSAGPTVNMKPTDRGVIAVVRYITKADERTATRYRLDQEIVKLFHHGEALVPDPALPGG